ncbi:MAG: ABC transporter ATP-binding protein/permease, partial [Alphaproteobacteria bacterium]|nr:ABC transporter ATP-binding protein/permease [Alphaproteobacteria bacterium]
MARSMSRGRPSSQAVSLRPQSSMWRTVKGFWPYLWPEDRADLRMRIIMATGLLIAAKLVTIAVPYTFKWATDALAPTALAEMDQTYFFIGIPVALTLLYGFSRVLMALLTQVRDAILMIIGYMVFTTKATEWRMGIRRSMNDSDTDASGKAVDSLLNFETVKYFGAETREAARYDKAMEKFEKASVKAYVSLAVLNSGQAIIFTLGLTVCMALVVQGIREGRHTVGDFVLVNAMLIQLYQPLNFMGMVYREIKQALIDIDQMFDILDQDPEIADRPGSKPLLIEKGEVRFDHVKFGYTPERTILDGVDFTVPAGKTVAIVGPSGAGKSTISRLMFRFYEPQSGRILIDGQDIGDVRQVSLRAAIGMVPQDTVLFNDTIYYNIRYGRWDATREEIEAAAKLAQIDEFIKSLPDGYETNVGERGLKLSGGEKQRVAIARTILKGPPILVLDEATSALDSFTER